MIGVEAAVDHIPESDDGPVILIRPARFGSRSCDFGFFAPLHDDLRSRVTILRHLPPEEVDRRCATLAAEAETVG